MPRTTRAWLLGVGVALALAVLGITMAVYSSSSAPEAGTGQGWPAVGQKRRRA